MRKRSFLNAAAVFLLTAGGLTFTACDQMQSIFGGMGAVFDEVGGAVNGVLVQLGLKDEEPRENDKIAEKEEIGYLASGGEVKIVEADGKFYEVHTFTRPGDDELVFSEGAPQGLAARVLVVAGGGSGGGGFGKESFDYGGGGGAGGVLSIESLSLNKEKYLIFVGDGGLGVGTAMTGNNGEDSSFDGYIAFGGGAGGGSKGWSSDWTNDPNYAEDGRDGGSGGGAGAGGAAPGQTVTGGSGEPGQGTDGGIPVNNIGGQGGGLQFESDITGTPVIYATGGAGCGPAGAPHTGNGGGGKDGAINGQGLISRGGSGIVAVRFPISAKRAASIPAPAPNQQGSSGVKKRGG
jgi:hypothetical protein